MSIRKKVSVRFIAHKAGVSTATVSRVLNNNKNVTEETRQKVLDVISKYKYDAPAVSSSKIDKIGVVIISSESDYYHSILGNIGRFFRDRGISTIAVNTEGVENYLPVALSTLYDAKVQGIILVSCSYQSVRENLHHKIPHVWIDCNDPANLTADICTVQSDHYISGKLAARELLYKGCRNPIILSGPEISVRGADRSRGFIEECRSVGIEVSSDQIINLAGIKSPVTESQEMIRYLITKEFPFDSVFATNDRRALGVYMGLLKLGFEIPKDIRLIGFDGVSHANTEVLNITSIQQNIPLMTRSACELLLKLIQHEYIEERNIQIPTALLPGQTT